MKVFKNRVQLEILVEVYTESEDEESAARESESIAEDMAKYLDHQIWNADGVPGRETLVVRNYGAKCTETEESEEE